MREEEPGIVPPKHLQLPQLSPQQFAAARQRLFPVDAQLEPQQSSSPTEVPQPAWQWVPQTPMPPPFSHAEMQLPDTPPILEAHSIVRPIAYPEHQSQDTPVPARPVLRYIPAKSRRKEIGTGEMLLGCFVLLLIGILVLALLYYIATPF